LMSTMQQQQQNGQSPWGQQPPNNGNGQGQ
jgi:hypothetical protein